MNKMRIVLIVMLAIVLTASFAIAGGHKGSKCGNGYKAAPQTALFNQKMTFDGGKHNTGYQSQKGKQGQPSKTGNNQFMNFNQNMTFDGGCGNTGYQSQSGTQIQW
jgi:hypothetical protein